MPRTTASGSGLRLLCLPQFLAGLSAPSLRLQGAAFFPAQFPAQSDVFSGSGPAGRQAVLEGRFTAFLTQVESLYPDEAARAFSG